MPEELIAVRIRMPRTRQAIVLGVFLLVLAVIFFGNIPIMGSALWGAAILLGKTEQVVSIEGNLLVFRTIAPMMPNLTKRIGMDRVAGHSFTVQRFRRDSRLDNYRPVVWPRLALMGDGGMPLGSVGLALTLQEAEVACIALNRLLAREGPCPSHPPLGVRDDDVEVL